MSGCTQGTHDCEVQFSSARKRTSCALHGARKHDDFVPDSVGGVAQDSLNIVVRQRSLRASTSRATVAQSTVGRCESIAKHLAGVTSSRCVGPSWVFH
jgi:hypothetical protein